jgi:hypothetical protein
MIEVIADVLFRDMEQLRNIFSGIFIRAEKFGYLFAQAHVYKKIPAHPDTRRCCNS